ncbi:MAG: site-specific integrase, partial [Rhizobiales bacterium]|nr:site-specific integrase [Hyphomicrobiales bacterium]
HAIIKKIGDKNLQDIDQGVVDGLAQELQPGSKNSTRVRHVYVPVIAVLNDPAVKRIVGIHTIEKPPVKQPAVKPATDEHILAVADVSNPRLKAAILFMTYSGCRVSEATSLTTDNVNLREALALLEKTKNGDPRLVPLPPQVVVAMANIMPKSGQVFGYSSRHGFTTALRRATRRAGLPWMSPHQIGRHAFAARLLRKKYDILTVKAAGRWKSTAVVDGVYGHLEQGRIHQAILDAAKPGTDCTDNAHLSGARSRSGPV